MNIIIKLSPNPKFAVALKWSSITSQYQANKKKEKKIDCISWWKESAMCCSKKYPYPSHGKLFGLDPPTPARTNPDPSRDSSLG